MVTCVTAVFLADDVGIEFLRRLVPGSVTSGYMGREEVGMIFVVAAILTRLIQQLVSEIVTWVTRRCLVAA